MKKVKLVTCLFVAMLITSCSNGLESAAKEQMEKTMKELAKDPSSVQISNVETMFSNDSICILHYKFSGKNGFGGVSSDEMEYIYITFYLNGEKITKETALKLDEKESILEKARDSYREDKWLIKNSENEKFKNMSDEDKKAWYIHFEAQMYMIFNGREVGKTKPSKYDVDKW